MARDLTRRGRERRRREMERCMVAAKGEVS